MQQLQYQLQPTELVEGNGTWKVVLYRYSVQCTDSCMVSNITCNVENVEVAKVEHRAVLNG